MRPLLALLVCCAAEPAARGSMAADASPMPEAPADRGIVLEAPAPAADVAEASTAPECTAIVASAAAPVDCAGTHGLWWCAGRGPNGCVPCPVEAVDGGLRRRLDCDRSAANGCETFEGDTNCGACGVACMSGQHCASSWPAAPNAFAPHCE